MILVLLGTSHLEFNRLLHIVDGIAESINEKIIVQKGYSSYSSKNYDSFTFCSREELIKLMQSSRVVISQGGFGSMYDSIKHSGYVIAIPREIQFNETAAEQHSLVDHYATLGLVVKCVDLEKLSSLINKIEINPRSVSNDVTKIPYIKDLIADYIQKEVI